MGAISLRAGEKARNGAGRRGSANARDQAAEEGDAGRTVLPEGDVFGIFFFGPPFDEK